MRGLAAKCVTSGGPGDTECDGDGSPDCASMRNLSTGCLPPQRLRREKSPDRRRHRPCETTGQELAMNDDLHGVAHGTGLRSVAVVSRHARPELLDTVLDAGDYDVVFLEEVGRAYSSIKRTAPQ